MKLTDNIDIVVNIKPFIYFKKPISEMARKQSQIILEIECDKLQGMIENIVIRRLQENNKEVLR